MADKDRIYLAWHGRNGASADGWSHPSWGSGYSWIRPEVYCDLAQQIEQAGVDMIVFSDGIASAQSCRADAGDNAPAVVARLDASPVIACIAATTSTIGLVPALDTSFYRPFMVARLICTLDHLSEGRIGWAVQPETSDRAARIFGIEFANDEAARFRKAEEFVKVCRKLWDSWEPDAIVGDWSTAVFADPAKVHEIDHKGEFFAVRGPLNTISSPQAQPVLVQAAYTDAEIAFAARTAEVVILTSESAQVLRAQTAKVRDLTGQAGRDPDELIVLNSISPFISASEEGAKLIEGRAVDHYDTAVAGSYRIVGTPSEVADAAEALLETTGADGFSIDAMWLPRYVSDIVSYFVPLLQRRGRVPLTPAGATFRERIGMPIA